MTTETPFKWVGSKNQLLPEIEAHLPKTIQSYYEPMCGSAAVGIRLLSTNRITGHKVVLGDLNHELIITLGIIKFQVEDLIHTLTTAPMYLDTSKEGYLSVRAMRPDDYLEVAARFIYLNRLGFNGLYRINQKGEFNVPYGQYTNPTICQADKLRSVSAQLADPRVRLYDQSYVGVVEKAEPGDFVYFDPPYYPVSDTAKFVSYTAFGFKHEDQVQLVQVAKALAQRGVNVMVSNSDVHEVRTMYEGFTFHPVLARRSVNCVGSRRGRVPELVICSYPSA